MAHGPLFVEQLVRIKHDKLLLRSELALFLNHPAQRSTLIIYLQPAARSSFILLIVLLQLIWRNAHELSSINLFQTKQCLPHTYTSSVSLTVWKSTQISIKKRNRVILERHGNRVEVNWPELQKVGSYVVNLEKHESYLSHGREHNIWRCLSQITCSYKMQDTSVGNFRIDFATSVGYHEIWW